MFKFKNLVAATFAIGTFAITSIANLNLFKHSNIASNITTELATTDGNNSNSQMVENSQKPSTKVESVQKPQTQEQSKPLHISTNPDGTIKLQLNKKLIPTIKTPSLPSINIGEPAQAYTYPTGLRYARVCNNEKNYSTDFRAIANGNVDRVEFKIKNGYNVYIPVPIVGLVYDSTSGYNWRRVATVWFKNNSGLYRHNTNIWNQNLTNEDVLVSIHVKYKTGETAIDPGGIINLGSIEKGKCSTFQI
jgi:hypothetical protein